MTSTSTAQVHEDYKKAEPYLKTIRDCIIGSPAIKDAKYTYLIHPSDVDTTSPEAILRYQKLLDGAEFDSFPDDTRRELLGKMRIGDSNILLNDELSMMVQNVDGDGMSLAASIEYAVNNIYQTKWHVLVSEIVGAPKSTEGMTKEQGQKLNVRPVIKQYTRESLIQWNFSKVNGIKQLSYAKFLEVSQDFNQESGTSEDVNNYVVLALDENGEYYQLKYSGEEVPDISERDYVKISGKPLNIIPITFVADEEMQPDCLPIQLGYLWGICDMTLHRYRVSADYKETQRVSSPTIFNNGWKDGDIEIFKESNNGRSYIATGGGAVNNMPDGVSSEVISASAEMTDYHWYFDNNEKKVRSMGGEANTQSVAMTATEAGITASKQNALLNTVADNAEDGFKRAIFLCGVMNGTYQLDDMESALEDILIELPRDFATPKLTPEEMSVYIQLKMMGELTSEQFLDIRLKGGWQTGEVDELMAEIEEQPPTDIVKEKVVTDEEV